MTRKTSRTCAYIGAGIGLAMFALFGLIYGSFIGGVIGLQITGQMFGGPAELGILPRIILALGVMLGVLLAAVACVAGSSLVGYLIGLVVDYLHIESKSVATTQAPTK